MSDILSRVRDSFSEETLKGLVARKYSYFVIKDYIEGEPAFFVCDRGTLAMFADRGRTASLDELTKRGDVVDTYLIRKTAPTRDVYDRGECLVVCHASEPRKRSRHLPDKAYVDRAGDKILLCARRGNSLERAFERKTAEERDDTFKVVGAFTRLDQAKDFLVRVQEARAYNSPIHADDVITPFRMKYNQTMRDQERERVSTHTRDLEQSR